MESFRLGPVRDRETWQLRFARDPPRLGRVRQVAVAQHDDRSHVLGRDANGLDRDVETVCGRGRRQHGERRVGVAAVHRLEQIRLLGLRRHAGRRAGAL